jgi:hypothetical protein
MDPKVIVIFRVNLLLSSFYLIIQEISGKSAFIAKTCLRETILRQVFT